jgi:hypothetical protein
MGSPVSLLGGNVLLDLYTVEEPVLRCFLSEFRWLSEDVATILIELVGPVASDTAVPEEMMPLFGI